MACQNSIRNISDQISHHRQPHLQYNCLLYVDDVALIGTKEAMPRMLQLCEQHSHQLGYRWSPGKCVLVQPPDATEVFTLYDTPIPIATSFSYLGVPINYCNDGTQLIDQNTALAVSSMRALNAIGVSPTGLSRLLACRLYAQFIRPKMEYGLAIIPFTQARLKKLDHAQDTCLRMIYGASPTSSNQSHAPSCQATDHAGTNRRFTSQVFTSCTPPARCYPLDDTTNAIRSLPKSMEKAPQNASMGPLPPSQEDVTHDSSKALSANITAPSSYTKPMLPPVVASSRRADSNPARIPSCGFR